MDHQATVSPTGAALDHGQPHHEYRASVTRGEGENVDVLEHSLC